MNIYTSRQCNKLDKYQFNSSKTTNTESGDLFQIFQFNIREFVHLTLDTLPTKKRCDIVRQAAYWN